MSNKISDAIKLYGTDENVEPQHALTAGALTCQFGHGALRCIKIHGKEAIRNIEFVVRDKDWGTYPPVLSNLNIKQNAHSFTITFNAVCKDEQQEIHYKASIKGNADGSLTFTGDYTAKTDFVTNRTGFVVLHPIIGVAGAPVSVEHVDGTKEESVFPELVDPVQPIKNIRALTHEILPGVRVCCRMTGETFEMEDHRQWNDASFKTYVRPLSQPWPFTIPASETHRQTVVLSVLENANTNLKEPYKDNPIQCVITVDKISDPHPMPRIGLGLEPEHLKGALSHQNHLTELAPQQLTLWYDLRHHGLEHLKQASELARGIETTIELQAVIPDVNFRSEIALLAVQCREANIELCAIHVAPSMYLRSIMPGPSWPQVTDLGSIYDEVRHHFPGIPVGGGTLSFFPELNRHRAPIQKLDFISHASNTITHACDDLSVTENLEALPYIVKTCRSFSGNKPYHVGPSSIGMRFNPYGSKTIDNPDNKRVAMARMDPRQRGLLNAAWTAGYVAHLARAGISCISLHAPTGEFGLLNYNQAWPRPGFDHTSKQVFPAYHVVAGFTRATGKQQLLAHSTTSSKVESIAYEENGQWILWIANLTPESLSVEIRGLSASKVKMATLSVDTFDQCTDSSQGFEQTVVDAILPFLNLGPCSVIRIST